MGTPSYLPNHTTPHHTTAIWPPLLHNREPSPPQGFPRNPCTLASTVVVSLALKSHCSVFTRGPAFRAWLVRLANLTSLETLSSALYSLGAAPSAHGGKLVMLLKTSSPRPTRLPGTVAVWII